MFQQLIASCSPQGPRLAGSGAVAVAAHALGVLVAVWATLRPHAPAPATVAPVVLTWPDGPSQRVSLPPAPVPAPPPDGLDGLIICDPPVGLPPIDAGTPVQPSVWLPGEGVATVALTNDLGDAGAAVVEEPPALLSAPRLPYPEPLRSAGITGRVVVQAVVDTTGRAEPASIVVIASANPGFDAAARSYVQSATFRPGRVHGRAVRIQVRVPIQFALTVPRH